MGLRYVCSSNQLFEGQTAPGKKRALWALKRITRYPGQYADVETGLYYNFHRYYDPRIGRYLRVDPIGFVGGDFNLYAYVWMNPVNDTDFLGLTPYPEIVQTVLPQFVPLIKEFIEHNKLTYSSPPECQKLILAVALKFIADEAGDRYKSGKKRVADYVQDVGVPLAVHLANIIQIWKPISTLWGDPSWKRGNWFERFLIRLNLKYNDIGFANIELEAAHQILHQSFDTASYDTNRKIIRAILTTEGTAMFAFEFALEAVADLSDFFCCTYARDTVEVMVSRIRDGEKVFWERVINFRHLTPEEFEEWKSFPGDFPDIPFLSGGKLDNDQFTFIEQLVN